MNLLSEYEMLAIALIYSCLRSEGTLDRPLNFTSYQSNPILCGGFAASEPPSHPVIALVVLLQWRRERTEARAEVDEAAGVRV